MALSSLLSLLLFAGMQIYSRQLASTEWLTIQGGLLGSGLFVFSLTVSSLRWKGGREWGVFEQKMGRGPRGLLRLSSSPALGFACLLLPSPVLIQKILLNSLNPGLQ